MATTTPRQDATLPAKRPVTALAGPYGHPFHPILVTVPIGAWVASFVFDLISHTADESAVFSKGAYWLIGLGILGAVAAAVFGLLDLLTIPRGTTAFKTGLTHLALNSLTLALFAVNFVMRRDDLDAGDPVRTSLIVLSAVALALLAASGWLGGKLTYKYGVRVATEADQTEGY